MPAKSRRKLKVPSLDSVELETLGIPLLPGASFPKLSESEGILFHRCCEIYRITEHFNRKRDMMLDVFSQYRVRTHFETALRTHYFETDEHYSGQFDPEFYAVILGAYHFVRTLSLNLTHAESQPTTLAQELTWANATLIKTWNKIAVLADSKYGWKFKTFLI